MTFRMIKPTWIILSLVFPFIGVIVAVSLPFLTQTDDFYFSLIIIITIGLFFSLFFILVIRRITVTENGIAYSRAFKSEYKSWNEIKFINLQFIKYRVRQKHPFFCIEFYGDCDKYPHDMFIDDVWLGSDAIQQIKEHNSDYDAFLRVQYRKKIITEISKYYHGEVLGLHLADRK